MAQQWTGQTRGTVLGYKIIYFILRHSGLRIAYLVLVFVSTWYFLFASSRRWVDFYFKEIHGYRGWKAFSSAWRNYYLFAQTLLDKFATMAGAANKFSVQRQGMEYLDGLAGSGKGAILISAHIGNWEVAGNMLNRLNTRFNVLMYDNERQAMKQFLDEELVEKKLHIISIDNENMSHLIAIHDSFRRGEMLVMHADRFVDGAQTKEMDFMGRKADFPTGPFYLAARFGVPICFVFAVKSGATKYQFFAMEPIFTSKERNAEKLQDNIADLMKRYVAACEDMLKKYPTQWFNFYPFWK